MREEEEEPSWFARWEEQLPTPEELMPLSQSLISPDLALAFDIPTRAGSTAASPHRPRLHDSDLDPSPPPPPPPPPVPHPYDSSDLSAAAGADEPARTLKRPRLVWTPQLHKRFVDAVAHLGIKNAVPKTIMQLMNVDGLTRENVASHLQKYRLYLKRMQGGLPSGAAAADAATEHLFSTAPVPPHFLGRRGVDGAAAAAAAAGGVGVPDQFMPFVPAAALQQHHQQMAAVAAATAAHQQQYYHQRHMAQMASPPAGGFEHGYMNRQQQQPGIQRVVTMGAAGAMPVSSSLTASYAGDLDSGADVGRRKELTLFPTGEN